MVDRSGINCPMQAGSTYHSIASHRRISSHSIRAALPYVVHVCQDGCDMRHICLLCRMERPMVHLLGWARLGLALFLLPFLDICPNMLITAQARGDMTGLDRPSDTLRGHHGPSTHFERPGVAMVGLQSQVCEGLERRSPALGGAALGLSGPAAPTAALLRSGLTGVAHGSCQKLELKKMEPLAKYAWRMSWFREP